jgi:hypothetical protein
MRAGRSLQPNLHRQYVRVRMKYEKGEVKFTRVSEYIYAAGS